LCRVDDRCGWGARKKLFLKSMKRNNALRLQIAEMVFKAGEGHIPSAYSILEILSILYGHVLRYKSANPRWEKRDYFILSKGHGCAALYILLEKHGFISRSDLEKKSTLGGILGGHPDSTKVPGIEASTGSLGHGISIALGIALGLKIRKKKNKVITLIGDGESNEGTVWEAALVAANLSLGNLCVIVDENGSADQILPVNPLRKKWQAFGWEVYEVDGHAEKKLLNLLTRLQFSLSGRPKVIIAHTIKGKGVRFMQGHGVWHSRVPTEEEMTMIREELL